MLLRLKQTMMLSRKQINGGIIAADISATAGIDQQHIMNGEYLLQTLTTI
jgi:hypothetical protein